MGNAFDTSELNDIRRMLGEDIPISKAKEKQQTGQSNVVESANQGVHKKTFNLDDILQEVSGVVDKANAEYEAKKPAPPQFTDTGAQKVPQQPEQPKPMEQREIQLPRKQQQPQPVEEVEEVQQQERPKSRVKDPEKEMYASNKRSKNIARRAIPVLLLGLVALYLTIAESLAFPIPDMIRYAKNPTLFVLVQVGLQIGAMLLSIDIVGEGFYSLVTLRANRASLVTLANMASILHGMTFIIAGWGGVFPYCSIGIILLYASMREEKNRLAGRARAYKAVTLHERPMGVYYHHDTADHARRTVKIRMSHREDFLRELERPDATERFAKVYAPIMLAASLVLAIVVAIARKDISNFFWVLSAMLTIACPLPIVCAFGKAYYSVSRRLLSEGAAMASGQAAFRIRKTRRAVLQDSDLFPSGTVSISEVRAHSGYTPERLLSYTVAVTTGYDMEISKLLAEALREQYGRPARATNIRVYDLGGVSGEIGGNTVLVGTAAYMVRMGMPVQEPKKGDEVQTGIYVVINGQPAGVIQLVYRSNAQTFSALQALLRLKIMPELATRDFNISPEMVQKMFETRRGRIAEVPADRMPMVSSSAYVIGDRVCAILSRDGITPFAQVHQSADKLSGAMRSNLILGAVGGICGLLLMFYLAFVGHPEAVTPKNVIFYLLLWYIPSFFITFHTRKGL